MVRQHIRLDLKQYRRILLVEMLYTSISYHTL
jgi:hypothetical protein